MDQLVEHTPAGLGRLAETLAAVPPTSLTEWIRVLVPSLVMDLSTKDVPMKILLPAYCDSQALVGLSPVSS